MIVLMDIHPHSRPAPPPSRLLLATVALSQPVSTRNPGRTFAGISGISLASFAALLGWGLGLRPDLGAIPTTPLLLYAATCLASFLAHLWAALVPPPGQVLPSAQLAARLPLVLSAITTPLGILLGTGAHGGLSGGHQTGFWLSALPCVSSGLAVAAAPTLLGVCVLHRLFPRGSWRAGLAVGGASSVLAGLALELHCPRSDLLHVGLVHGSVMVAPALILALLGLIAALRPTAP